MKQKKNITKAKGLVRNPDLDKYAGKVLFKKKVEMANQILKTAGVPKF